MDEKQLEQLYKAVSQRFDIGDYNSFKTRMATANDRKRFYDAVGGKGFDLGEYDMYESRLSGVKKKDGGGASTTSLKTSSPKSVSSIDDLTPVDATPEFEQQKKTFEQAQNPEVNDDPVGNVVRKTAVRKQEIKQQHSGRDATYVAGNYQNLAKEVDDITKQERAAQNFRFENTADAKGVLQKFAPNIDELPDEAIAGLDVKDNMTAQRAKEQVLDSRLINKLLSSNSTFESAAVQFGAIKNPLIAKQIETQGGELFSSKSQKGALVSQLLQQPAVKEWARQSQDNMNTFRAAQNNFIANYPDLAAAQLATVLSKEREKRKMNNGFLNSVSNKEMDAVVNEMVESGDLTPQQRVVYEKLLRPQTKGLRNPYQTPGFFENLPTATKDAIKGMARSIEEGIDVAVAGNFINDDVALRQDLEEDYTKVDFKPKGLWHEFSRATATLTPQVLLMGTGIKGLQALNAIKNPAVSGALLEGMQSYGYNVSEARKQFPNEPTKQMAHATLTTALEMAMSRVFPDEKVVEGISKVFKGKAAGVIADYADNKITAAAAKELLQSDVQRILTETLPQFVGKTLKNTQKEALEEVVPQVLSDVLTDVFEGKPVEERELWANAFDTWKQTTLGSGVISGLAANADTPPLMRSMLYDLAKNADAISRQNLDADVLENLTAAQGIVADLEKTELTQKQKEKVLLQELHQNVLQRQLKETTANFAKEKLKEQINASKEVVAKVLETRAEQVAAKEEKQVNENKETETEVPQVESAHTESIQVEQRQETTPVSETEPTVSVSEQTAEQQAPPPLSETELAAMQPVENNSEPQNEPQNETQNERQKGLLEPYTTKNGKYTISIENGQRVIKDKDGNSPSEKTARTYFNEHAESLNYNQGNTVEQKGITPPQFSSEEEAGRWVAENSDNPSEIADLYIKTEKMPTALSSKENAILTGIDSGIGIKVTEDSYRRFGDANNQNNSKARYYFDNTKGRSMDEIAREISDHTGVEVSPQDIADFIDRFPSGDYQARKMNDTDVHNAAKQRFEQLTGIPLTDKVAKLAAEQLYSQEAIAEAEAVVDSEPLPEADLMQWLQEEVNNIFEEENVTLDYELTQDTTTDREQPADESDVEQDTTGQTGTGTQESAQQGGAETTTEGKVKKKKILTQRAYEAEIRPQVKKRLEEKGLLRELFSQQERSQQAADFIQEFGEDAAFTAVETFDVRGAMATSILAQLRKSANRQMAALEATDTEQLDELAGRIADIDALAEREGYFGGEYIGQLGYEYQDVELGYNSEKQVERWETALGIKPTEEQLKEWRSRDKEIAELNKRAEEAEKRAKEAEEKLLIENIQESIAREKKAKAGKEYAQKALDAIGKVRAKIKANNYADVTGMVAIVDTGLATIEAAIKGGMAITSAIEKGIRHIKSKLKEQGVDTWEKEDAFRKDVTQAFEEAGIERQKATMKNNRVVIPHSIIRNLVEDGINNINDLTKAVQNIVKQDLPEVTERQVRDGITEYGKTVNPDPDVIEAQIRKMKRIGRIISGLEDIAKKKRPLRSGRQRDKLEADERAELKKLREAMKELPMDEETEAKELKTSLDAAKQRLRNQIEDLQRQIDTKEKVERSKKALPEDDELRELREQRDKKKEEFEQIFGNNELSDEQRLQNAIKAVEKSIDEYERRIKEKDLEPKQRSTVAETPELKKVRERRDALKDELKKLQDEAGIAERRRLDNAKKRAQARIDELQTRLKNKDFSKKVTKPVVADTELININAEKLRIKEEYDKEFYKAQLANRTKAEKIKDTLWELWGITRALRATGEMSFVGMQGLIQTIAHPIHAAKAFRNSMRFIASEKKAEQWLREIKSQEWYPMLKESKLALTEPHAEITAREELFFSGWTNMFWDTIGAPLKLAGDKAYNGWANANPFKALERAAVGYLDTIRVERFLDGVQILQEQGKDFQNNKQDYKDVADAINTMTGRASLGKAEMIAPQLAKIFFSPRNWASAIKTSTPYAIYHFGKMTPTARKMAIYDFSKWIGVTTGMVMTAAAYYNNDDDEKTGVEFDPRSSDFMKIKVGTKRVDPWGGRIQMIVLQARLIMDAMKNSKGKIIPLGTPYKAPTRKETLIKMATNKLAPSAAMVSKYLSTRWKKENGEKIRIDEFGEKYDLPEEIKSNLYPIYFDTVTDLLDDDPNAMDGLLTFLAFFGMGVQEYEEKQKKKSSSEVTWK